MSADKHRIPRNAIMVPVPDVTQQTEYSCGAASLEAICKYYGVGAEDEWEFVRDLKMDTRVGSHPFQIIALAKKYGLSVREYERMSFAQLKRELGWKHPVMISIQAYAKDDKPKSAQKRWRKDYTPVWTNGHWVVAIGFDRTGVYFEDPAIEAKRGWLPYEELKCRWHDTGPHGIHLPHFGLAVWRAGRKGSAYDTVAVRIP
jgi:predicted double-glycine peptidase